MSLIVVEHTFEQPQSETDLAAIAEREHKCKEIRSITWKRSALSKDRRRMICEWEAPDAETVRRVQVEAGVPFDRIWPATLLE
jgi:Protein of unknown function (DUF4242)